MPGQADLAHLLHGEPLSQALFSRLHSRQLNCGLLARECGDEAGDEEVADMSGSRTGVVGLAGMVLVVVVVLAGVLLASAPANATATCIVAA